MTKNIYSETLSDIKILKSDISDCKKNSVVYALDFAFETQKDLAKHKLTLEQAKDIEHKLYEIVSLFPRKCLCKKYK